MRNMDFPLPREYRRSFGASIIPELDFITFNSGQYWTQVLTGSGTGALVTSGANAIGGQYKMVTTTTQNSGSLVYTTNPIFLFTGGSNPPNTGKSMAIEASLQFTEGSVNKANVFFGFCSLNTNVILQDGTGVPSTNFWGALIYKSRLQTQWQAIASAGTTQQTASSNTNSGLSNLVRLGIECKQIDNAGNYEITYYSGAVSAEDRVPLTTGTTYPLPIKFTQTSASAAVMYAVCGVKTVEATGIVENLFLDYLFPEEMR